jgi:predicted metal-dependent enzyme (double-stranded beta helix superfamily)
MSIQTTNALDRFVSKTRDLFARETDLETRWTALTPMLAELLADPEVIAASKKWPACIPRDGRAENLIFYVDPDYQFAVNGLVVEAEGRGRTGKGRIHDHAHIYTLYGVLDGQQKIERYQRLDDRSKPGFAEIREAEDLLVGPGVIDLVRPYEVHSETNLGERTVAVIVRSQQGGTFNQGRYVPEKNEYYESLGPRQTPVDMLDPEHGTGPRELARN